MASNHPSSGSVEQLAEHFLACCRRGERPDLEAYLRQHPEHSNEIRELVSATMLLSESEKSIDLKTPQRASELSPGALERFRILGEVGRGAMAVVYDATFEPVGRIALKVLPRERAAQSVYRRHFEREGHLLARLRHEHIVRLLASGELDGLPYQAMPFVEGCTLDVILTELRRRRRSVGDSETQNETLLRMCQMLTGNESNRAKAHYFHSIAEIGLQVADALAHVHEQRVVHCDIKPANILLDRDGKAWLTDFGLARDIDDQDLTKVEGTPRYMAPERFGGRTEPRSDIYSLGITLYELLTLQPAFPVLERSLLIRQIHQTHPPRPSQLEPSIPHELETIVLKAIAKKPEHRQLTAVDLAADLAAYLELNISDR